MIQKESHAVRTFLCLLLTFVFIDCLASAQPLLAASDQKPVTSPGRKPLPSIPVPPV